jgi:putative ABC transport system permease protein
MLLTVGFAVLIAGSVATSAGAYASRDAATVRAGSVLLPAGTPGLSDAAVAAVAGTALLPTTVYADDVAEAGAGAAAPGGVPVRAAGIDPAGFAQVNGRLSVLSGAFDGLREPDTAVIAAGLADRLGWAVGGSAVLGYPDGSSGPVRLVAVVADGSIPVEMLLTREAVRARDPSALTEAVFGTGPAAGSGDSGSPGRTDEVRALPAELGARLVSVADYADDRAAEEDRLVWIATLILIGVSAGYTAVALANTLLMATAHRTRELLLLLRSGATVRQVLASVAAESTLVVLIGTTVGLVVPTIALLAIRSALSEQVGVPVDLVIPWPTMGVVVGGCLVLALAASVAPARLALRAGPGGGIVHRAE